ncbi:MAG: enoyl-CoA hydratase-related protein [Thermaerobacter sp.]|nr:enoyl-CoA hydratase-related protein [Thermaerobacter sp.]
MTTESDLLRERRDGFVATLTLTHPPVNAMSLELLQALDETFGRLAKDEAVRVVVLTGEGICFSAGADLKSVMSTGPAALLGLGREVYPRIAAFPKPLIAAVNGLCLGGGLELALCADIRLCAESAKFGQPEINLGIIPGWGGTQRLPAAIGLQRARELIYSGRQMRAAEAAEAGLVLHSYPDDELRDQAHNLARALAEKPPLALAAAKQAITAWSDRGAEEGHRLEGEAMVRLSQTQDAAEGIMAMFEKRRPKFQGR